MNFLDRMNLRPAEKRLVVIIGAVFFVVINIWFVWPHFNDWNKAKDELAKTRQTLSDYRAEIARTGDYQKARQRLEGQGAALMREEAAVQLRRTVDTQTMQSGVIPNGITDQAPKPAKEPAFEERSVTMGYINTPDNALVDFLFNIGERSMIRVRDLTVRPDQSNQKLQGTMTLTATYQKRTAPAVSPSSSGSKSPASTNKTTSATNQTAAPKPKS